MVGGVEAGPGRRPRRFRTVSEKRRIAELTFEPGASVSFIARANGVNANQVFKWRRALKRGELNEPATALASLIPVTLTPPCETVDARGEVGRKGQSAHGGSIHIEILGKSRDQRAWFFEFDKRWDAGCGSSQKIEYPRDTSAFRALVCASTSLVWGCS